MFWKEAAEWEEEGLKSPLGKKAKGENVMVLEKGFDK